MIEYGEYVKKSHVLYTIRQKQQKNKECDNLVSVKCFELCFVGRGILQRC